MLGIFQNLIRQKPFPSLGPKPSRQQPISNNRRRGLAPCARAPTADLRGPRVSGSTHSVASFPGDGHRAATSPQLPAICLWAKAHYPSPPSNVPRRAASTGRSHRRPIPSIVAPEVPRARPYKQYAQSTAPPP